MFDDIVFIRMQEGINCNNIFWIISSMLRVLGKIFNNSYKNSAGVCIYSRALYRSTCFWQFFYYDISFNMVLHLIIKVDTLKLRITHIHHHCSKKLREYNDKNQSILILYVWIDWRLWQNGFNYLVFMSPLYFYSLDNADDVVAISGGKTFIVFVSLSYIAVHGHWA